MSYKDIIKNQLPDGLYKDNRVHDKEIQVLGNALDDAQGEVDKLEIELLVVTAEDEGLKKNEELFNIPTDTEKPIEQRRSAIISRFRGNSTVTKALIKSVAESYDKGTVEVIEEFEQYTFIVRFIDTEGIPANIEDLKAAIEDIKPAHLQSLYRFKYLVISEMNTIRISDLDTMSINDFENYQ